MLSFVGALATKEDTEVDKAKENHAIVSAPLKLFRSSSILVLLCRVLFVYYCFSTLPHIKYLTVRSVREENLCFCYWNTHCGKLHKNEGVTEEEK